MSAGKVQDRKTADRIERYARSERLGSYEVQTKVNWRIRRLRAWDSRTRGRFARHEHRMEIARREIPSRESAT